MKPALQEKNAEILLVTFIFMFTAVYNLPGFH